jgi:hypothetical protein
MYIDKQINFHEQQISKEAFIGVTGLSTPRGARYGDRNAQDRVAFTQRGRTSLVDTEAAAHSVASFFREESATNANG